MTTNKTVQIQYTDKYLAWAFKDEICKYFCNRSGTNKCEKCPASMIDATTYKQIRISDILQLKKKTKKRRLRK